MYIEQLNDWLQQLKLKQIERDNNLNYIFLEDSNTIQKILDKENIYYYSSSERQEIIIFLLLVYKYISIKELKKILNVSNITLRNDILNLSNLYKEIFELEFSKTNIEIKNIKEIPRRSILCKLIKFNNKFINDFLDKIPSKLFGLLLELLEEKCLITISNTLKYC